MPRIGPIELDSPFVQAALSGYSDAPMRVVARRMGCPYTLHEVVLDKLVVQPGKFQRQLVRIPAEDHPVGGQLMGAEPAQFGAAARFMAEAGFDVIDINFGCPVKKVLGRCRGGYLLSEPATAIEIIRRVRDAVPAAIPVTLKMRRGMDDSAAAERNFFTIFDAALEHGLAAVCVHGRTVAQRYAGPSRWDFLERVRRHAPSVTLFGSGDVFTAEDAVRMLRHTGVDGVWIARGCIGNPWIFREAQALWRGTAPPPAPGVAEQGRVIREHFELAVAWEGEARAARTMRKFGIRYSVLHPAGVKVRDAFVRCRTAAEWRGVLDEWYSADHDGPAVDWATRRAQLIAAGASLAECG
jgi:nifR3 family TIM-barrel protein